MTTLPLAGPLRPTRTLQLDLPGSVEVTVQDRDRTRPFLLLHGGGVATMAGFADLLAERTHSRVLLPTHPGFAGTPKPAELTSVTELARVYVAMLEQLDLTDVTVVGSPSGSATSTSRSTCCGARATASPARSTGALSPPRSHSRPSPCSPAPATCRNWRPPKNCSAHSSRGARY
ncbi:alpha/beta fold hydrolase [Kribbella qitaiheensis]|uniref:alpha/beta fold hydrolase n=1 Tax=Kribbella qitaiheensis TaxID=1544730 RepID=UPI0019D61909|nr:hypothetical protein [Kribbella qitaiheensis]